MSDDTPAVPAPASRSGNQPKCPVCGSTWRAECMMTKPHHLPPPLTEAASRSGEDHAAAIRTAEWHVIQTVQNDPADRNLARCYLAYAALLSRDSGEAVKRAQAMLDGDWMCARTAEKEMARNVLALSASAARLTEDVAAAEQEFRDEHKRRLALHEDNKRLREALGQARHWIICSGAKHPGGVVQQITDALTPTSGVASEKRYVIENGILERNFKGGD